MRIIEFYIFVRNNIVYLVLLRFEYYLMIVSRIVYVDFEKVYFGIYVSVIFFYGCYFVYYRKNLIFFIVNVLLFLFFCIY